MENTAIANQSFMQANSDGTGLDFNQIKEAGLHWTVSPLKSNPNQGYLLFLVAFLTVIVGTIWMHSPILGLLGGLMILGGLADFWMTQSYEISSLGVKSKIGLSQSELEWKLVKSIKKERDGVRVLPVDSSSRMAAFRGVWLRPGYFEDIKITQDYLFDLAEKFRGEYDI